MRRLKNEQKITKIKAAELRRRMLGHARRTAPCQEQPKGRIKRANLLRRPRRRARNGAHAQVVRGYDRVGGYYPSIIYSERLNQASRRTGDERVRRGEAVEEPR